MNLERSRRLIQTGLGMAVGGYVCPEDPGEPGGGQRVSIALDEAEVLSEYARDKHVLEIGTGLGVSTRAMAQTAVRVYTYDVDPWVQREVWPMLLADYGNIVVVTHPYDIGGEVDVAFIDGAHDQDSVEKDTELALLLVKPGGVLLYHDPGTFRFPEALRKRGLEWKVLPTTFQIGTVQL